MHSSTIGSLRDVTGNAIRLTHLNEQIIARQNVNSSIRLLLLDFKNMVPGNKVVEVKNMEINKGKAALTLI